MTEPAHGDPIAVILARMEVKLDNALEQQKEHKSLLDKHGATLELHGTRLTKLETAREGDGEHEQRIVSNRTVFWTAVAAVVAIIGLVITLFVMSHGGG
jgi:hypothetical protein